MPKYSLIPFDLQTAPLITIESELNISKDALFISYKLKGAVNELDLGLAVPNHARVMNLWNKTCFEFFVKNSTDTYLEFNFSPVFEWNCFKFEKIKSNKI